MNRPTSTSEESYTGFYSVIAPLVMGKGVGDGKNTACLVAQAATIDALRKGQTLETPTDNLECACPLLRRLAISANDAAWWKSNEERTEVLRPLIPLLLDSRGSLALTQRRAARYSNAVIHELTPMRLEWIIKNTKSKGFAAECKKGIATIGEIKPIKDKASALKAKEALSKLKAYAYADASASASAYAYADAYAYAYADAYTDAYAYAYADAYTDAYAYTDADAYAYAYADAYAYASASAYAYAYAQKLKYRDGFIVLFKELAAMKE